MKIYKQSNKVMGGGGETAEVKGEEGSEKNETTEEKTAYLRDLRRSHSILRTPVGKWRKKDLGTPYSPQVFCIEFSEKH